ncbi:DUF1178 family protein [Primorskyibacter sp. S187A]|uniref:DUF1178 family protein n=1 Tax=Primorskyibacter sp. S187A TaxID=3415130 RepID=UPI003C7C1296
MIRYALKCEDDHRFESWFQSADAYEALAKSGHLSCAICGSSDVVKDIMAPRVALKSNTTDTLSTPASPPEQMLAAMKKHVEDNATYVGGDFAKKAREMHLGETPETSIYGEAKLDEAKALIDEGVPVAPLPFRPTNKSN